MRMAIFASRSLLVVLLGHVVGADYMEDVTKRYLSDKETKGVPLSEQLKCSYHQSHITCEKLSCFVAVGRRCQS